MVGDSQKAEQAEFVAQQNLEYGPNALVKALPASQVPYTGLPREDVDNQIERQPGNSLDRDPKHLDYLVMRDGVNKFHMSDEEWRRQSQRSDPYTALN